jgi:hypothetical protein
MIAKSTSSGLKAMVALVVLRNKAIKPLLAAAQDLRPSRGASSHSNAHAVHRRSYLWRGRHFFNKAQDATQRDRNPRRTIVEFISKLIQGFENQEAPEQELQVSHLDL